MAKDHEGMQEGHDIFHVARVIHYGRIVYLTEWGNNCGVILAELACLCHNADRVLEKKIGKEKVNNQTVEKLCNEWLDPSSLSGLEKKIIINAVLLHNGRNDSKHSEVAIALRDADRVVNLELDVVIRAGQLYHHKPPLDYDCFFKTPPNYRNPETVIEDLALCLEWVDPSLPFCMQTKTGMKLGQDRAKALKWYFATLKAQLEESGFIFKK